MTEEYLGIATSAAANAVAVLHEGYLNDAHTLRADGKDLKTEADLAAQEAVLAGLNRTSIPVVSEESTATWKHGDVDRDELTWIVDPLDGTVNFARGFPMSAVSVSLWRGRQPMVGVIHEVHNNNVYRGMAGAGAWLNDQCIQVSTEVSLANAILATGFPSGRSYGTDSLLKFVGRVQRYKKVRMLGSAALMIAHVAAGHFDAYVEEDIYLWDVAAGLALLDAAGGRFRIERGSGTMKYHVHAWNGHLHFDSDDEGQE